MAKLGFALHNVLLTALPILIFNTPFCSEFNVVSFYMGIVNTNLGSIFGSVPIIQKFLTVYIEFFKLGHVMTSIRD